MKTYISSPNLVNENYLHRNPENFLYNSSNSNLASETDELSSIVRETETRIKTIIRSQEEREDQIIKKMKISSDDIIKPGTGQEHIQLFDNKHTQEVKTITDFLMSERDQYKAQVDTLAKAAETVIERYGIDIVTADNFNFYEAILEEVQSSPYVNEITIMADSIKDRIDNIKIALGNLDTVNNVGPEISKFRRRLRKVAYDILPKRVAKNVVGSLRAGNLRNISGLSTERIVRTGLSALFDVPENANIDDYLNKKWKGVEQVGSQKFGNGGSVKTDVFVRLNSRLSAGFSAKYASINDSITMHTAGSFKNLISTISLYKGTERLVKLMQEKSFQYNLINAFNNKLFGDTSETQFLNEFNLALSANGHIFIGNNLDISIDSNSREAKEYFGSNAILAQNDFFYFGKSESLVRVSVIMKRLQSAIFGQAYSDMHNFKYTRTLNISPYEETLKQAHEIRTNGTNRGQWDQISENLLSGQGYDSTIVHNWGGAYGNKLLEGAWTISFGK